MENGVTTEHKQAISTEQLATDEIIAKKEKKSRFKSLLKSIRKDHKSKSAVATADTPTPATSTDTTTTADTSTTDATTTTDSTIADTKTNSTDATDVPRNEGKEEEKDADTEATQTNATLQLWNKNQWYNENK